MSYAQLCLRSAPLTSVLIALLVGCTPTEHEAEPDYASLGPDLSSDTLETLPASTPDTLRAAASGGTVVHGRAELEVGARAYLPADYVRVRLSSGQVLREAWTSATGTFAFDSVPPGSYELEIFDSPKGTKVAYRRTVQVGNSPVLELPALHIPIDSVSLATRP